MNLLFDIYALSKIPLAAAFFQFGSPSLLLAKRKYYLNGTDSMHIRAYRTYILELLELLGKGIAAELFLVPSSNEIMFTVGAETEILTEPVERIIDFEIRLANVSCLPVAVCLMFAKTK